MGPVRTLVVAMSVALLAQTSEVRAQPSKAPSLEQAVQAYSAAWDSRDPARIAALHTDDSTFQLFVQGAQEARGRVDIEAQFRRILADNPGYRSTVRAVSFAADAVTIEYDIHMHPPAPFTFGDARYEPNGKAYALPAIDVIAFQNGLVLRKVTYLDSGVIRANSRAITTVR